MIKFFTLDNDRGLYTIRPSIDNVAFKHIKGSYSVIMARLLGLDYHEMADVIKRRFASAKVINSKSSIYYIIKFTDKKDGEELVNVLNKKMNEVWKHFGGEMKSYKE